MTSALKIVLQGLVLSALVCVGLGGHPQAFGAAPPEPTSIRSGLGPDSHCVVVRRVLSSDSTPLSDCRPIPSGLPPSTPVALPAPWRLISDSVPVDRSVVSCLVLDSPRARAPPAHSIA